MKSWLVFLFIFLVTGHFSKAFGIFDFFCIIIHLHSISPKSWASALLLPIIWNNLFPYLLCLVKSLWGRSVKLKYFETIKQLSNLFFILGGKYAMSWPKFLVKFMMFVCVLTVQPTKRSITNLCLCFLWVYSSLRWLRTDWG